MFSLVVAADLRLGIGLNGKIPWHYPEDLKHFKELTTNGVVIMGRKTYESIGRELPNRINIIISSSLSLDSGLDLGSKGATLLSSSNASSTSIIIVKTPMDAVKYCSIHCKDKNKFVIGGAEIYRWFLVQGLIATIYFTQIPGYYNCDRCIDLPTTNMEHVSTYPIANAEGHEKISCDVYQIINTEEIACLSLMQEMLTSGNSKLDRTKIGTLSVFGKQLRFNLRNNTFPLMTTRKMFFRGIFAELMLFIRGQTNNQFLENQKINIWRGNTTREFLDARGLSHMPVGDMGASYGFLFRHFGAKYNTCLDNYDGQGVDQLANVINTIKTNPNDRRMIISLWDPTNLNNCPLPPCLYNYQFYVNGRELSCMMTQRSSDFMVAGGWNIATGSLLTYLIATICDLTPAELIWNLGDTHIYNNIIEQARLQIARKPRLYPKLFIAKKENITDFEFSDLELINYDPHPSIELVMNV